MTIKTFPFSQTAFLLALNKKPSPFVHFFIPHLVGRFAMPVLLAVTMGMTGCQTMNLHKNTPPPISSVPSHPSVVAPASAALASQSTVAPPLIQNFTITGKIGITTPKQSGSAFYSWSQANRNFAIDLSGAFGVGHTTINYNGVTATLTSDKTGTLTASDPETLLQKATGWQAPISQLAYWIMGQNAPNDTPAATTKDSQNRITTAQNTDWTANFSYPGDKGILPNKIIMTQPNKAKITLTITHL